MTDSRQVAGDIASEIVDTFTTRGKVYGPPEINFQNIANFWNAWLWARHPATAAMGLELDAVDVGHMSALIKKARLANSIDHRDSALDDATYTLLAAGVASLPDIKLKALSDVLLGDPPLVSGAALSPEQLADARDYLARTGIALHDPADFAAEFVRDPATGHIDVV